MPHDTTISSSAERRAIRVLPADVVAGIAAGEVVERPASVVKELVENALDAGARRVRVDYGDRGGVSIEVTDDGSGIRPDEVDLALTRHATSKLSELDDLASVSTFGFRGEALASLAAVSDLEIESTTPGGDAGVYVRVRDGAVAERRDAPPIAGTRVRVRDLFANVPARRKFLKSAATESQQVSDTLRRLALLSPDAAIEFLHNGRAVFALPQGQGEAARTAAVLGDVSAAQLTAVDAGFAGMRLRGQISNPGESWGTSRRVHLFVAGRWVRDRALYRAVLDGYHSYLVRGRFPAAILFLDVPRGEVDINVHPAKTEVRFTDPRGVAAFVREAVVDALRDRGNPLGRWGIERGDAERREVRASRRPLAAGPAPRAAEAEAAYDGGATAPAEDSAAPNGAGEDAQPALPGYRPGAAEPSSDDDFEQRELPRAMDSERLGSLDVLGQVFRGYIVGQADGALVLVDQHAAHERMLYEELLERAAAGAVPSQALVAPLRVAVGSAGVEAAVTARDALVAGGWDVDAFGDDELLVRAVPATAARSDPAALVEAAVADLVDRGAPVAESKRHDRILATVACHAAVRVGDALNPEQCRSLLAEIATVEFHASCPHGRPVARSFERGAIERRFGR